MSEKTKRNNKGQFSIIAAVLVAVILIATVIVTYSNLRSNPVQNQPQTLSAIDETNFALERVLGFTLGYYGSLLKVTGNTSYARTLTSDYLRSGLVYVAHMNPQWGASFDVNNLDIEAYWYKTKSYSKANLKVNYSLTGLGIYGITHGSASKLQVQVENTTSENQAQIIVTKDGDEPLINLGKQNFKFYSFNYENKEWELISLNTEPVSFANGTYLIDVPSGVDSSSYFVQVEDPRGIIVVASSFNQYTIISSWNPEAIGSLYSVVGSAPQILGAPDGNYETVSQGFSCEVTRYQKAIGTIKQVYFNITYYGSVSGTLEWYYNLDSSGWNKIEDLLEGGNSSFPLTRTYNATNLRGEWTWDNLNSTSIRFVNNDVGAAENGYIDAVYATVSTENFEFYSGLKGENVVVEIVQDGVMRWLGEDLVLTTQAKPLPPIPVKSIHINQTINSINREVHFQVEDWSSNYQIPVGLTSNVTILSNRQMIVFLANQNVSKTVMWWDGFDKANQTIYARDNRYFAGDDASTGKLTNGILTLQFQSGFILRSSIGSTYCEATFMRINSEASVYGSSLAYVITEGVVRDIVHQEAEWSGGAVDCPNVYSHIVLTLPANSTYYTYQLRLMFIDSQQSRTITDLCPIKLAVSTGQQQTEDGTLNDYPIVSTSTGLFYNQSSANWEHHWSQFTSGTQGGGIMFTDVDNQKLYAFDAIAGDNTGALKVSSGRIIELLPVTMNPVSFNYAYDITWKGAVVTFDDTTPIYKEDGGTKTGLWIIVEHPPTITVTTQK